MASNTYAGRAESLSIRGLHGFFPLRKDRARLKLGLWNAHKRINGNEIRVVFCF